ncbi:MAG: hypothetical protein KBT27_10515 [Prevotellaceae bacterium]|nr:hypothetical protein [Candidatus Faecinaster equi]
MARLKDPTKPLCELEALDLSTYDKGILEDIQLRLAALLEHTNEAINNWDYNQELKALKKKYNIQ